MRIVDPMFSRSSSRRRLADDYSRARSGGLLLGRRFLKHAHDVAFFHDQVIDVVELDLGARPFAEQHAIALLQVDRNELAGFVAATRADGDDLALRRLLLGGVGDDDATGGLRLGINTLDNDAVVKRAKFHDVLLWFQRVSRLQRLIVISKARCGSEILAARSDQATLLITLDTLVLMGLAASVAVS